MTTRPKTAENSVTYTVIDLLVPVDGLGISTTLAILMLDMFGNFRRDIVVHVNPENTPSNQVEVFARQQQDGFYYRLESVTGERLFRDPLYSKVRISLIREPRYRLLKQRRKEEVELLLDTLIMQLKRYLPTPRVAIER